MEASLFCNPYKLAVFGRSEAPRCSEMLLRKDAKLQGLLLELSGTRPVCRCQLDQTCHADSIISVCRDMCPHGSEKNETQTKGQWPSRELQHEEQIGLARARPGVPVARCVRRTNVGITWPLADREPQVPC